MSDPNHDDPLGIGWDHPAYEGTLTKAGHDFRVAWQGFTRICRDLIIHDVMVIVRTVRWVVWRNVRRLTRREDGE